MLPPGLYEQVIHTALNRALSEIPDARKADVVQKGLEHVVDDGGEISTQIDLANQIVTFIRNTTQEADFASLNVEARAEQLLALLREQDPRLAVGKTAADHVDMLVSFAYVGSHRERGSRVLLFVREFKADRLYYI